MITENLLMFLVTLATFVLGIAIWTGRGRPEKISRKDFCHSFRISVRPNLDRLVPGSSHSISICRRYSLAVRE